MFGAFAAMLPTPPAVAETDREPDATVRAAMLLDCAGLNDDAFDYAVDKGYCEKAAEGGDSAPQDVRWGVCGYSHISIYNEGYGRARWEYGYGSIAGVVISHELTIRWTNADTEVSDSFWDNTKGIPSPAYHSEYSRSVGRGEVVTSLWGTTTLHWGGTCQVEVPTAYAKIT
ncbi:hypothetical protein NOGI109294_02540 [Nocardiopsis gilva]